MSTLSPRPKNKHRRVWRTVILLLSWTLVAVCAVIIFSLSHETATQSAGKSNGVIAMLFARFGITVSAHFIRKSAHALEYFGLAVLLYNAYGQSFRVVQPTLTVLTAVLYAAGDEIHQYFIAGRACQMRDVFVDAVGAAVGVLCCTVAYWLLQKCIQSISKKKGT
ncbi:MAG: VanZ family protein [Candidatus Fimenecus sp.]